MRGSRSRVRYLHMGDRAHKVPVPLFKNLNKVSASYKLHRLRFRIGNGYSRTESYSLRDPAIALKPMGMRMADLPVNASFLGTLAMMKLFSVDEIADCGLAARVLDAQEKATAAVELATSSLALFQIPRADIRKLRATQQTRLRAEIQSSHVRPRTQAHSKRPPYLRPTPTLLRRRVQTETAFRSS